MTLYLFLSLLVSAYPRHLYVIVPFLLFWFAYIINKTITFKQFIKTENIYKGKNE